MAQRKSVEEKEYELLISNTRELLKLRHGKDFLWYVLSICDIYSVNTIKDMQGHYDGRRSVGLEVLSLLEDVDPTAYPRLLLEKQSLKGDTNE